MKVYLNEDKLPLLKESQEEITYYEFNTWVRNFLKDLLNNPAEAQPNQALNKLGLNRKELIKHLKKRGLLKSKENIDEVPNEDNEKKLRARYTISFSVPRQNFERNMHRLHTELCECTWKKKTLNEGLVSWKYKDNIEPFIQQVMNDFKLGTATNFLQYIQRALKRKKQYNVKITPKLTVNFTVEVTKSREKEGGFASDNCRNIELVFCYETNVQRVREIVYHEIEHIFDYIRAEDEINNYQDVEEIEEEDFDDACYKLFNEYPEDLGIPQDFISDFLDVFYFLWISSERNAYTTSYYNRSKFNAKNSVLKEHEKAIQRLENSAYDFGNSYSEDFAWKIVAYLTCEKENKLSRWYKKWFVNKSYAFLKKVTSRYIRNATKNPFFENTKSV